MLERPTPAAKRQREYRKRKSASEKVYPVRAGELVHEALIARSIDSGMSPEAAGREARNRKKVSADLDQITLEWAQSYLVARKKTRDA